MLVIFMYLFIASQNIVIVVIVIIGILLAVECYNRISSAEAKTEGFGFDPKHHAHCPRHPQA